MVELGRGFSVIQGRWPSLAIVNFSMIPLGDVKIMRLCCIFSSDRSLLVAGVVEKRDHHRNKLVLRKDEVTLPRIRLSGS